LTSFRGTEFVANWVQDFEQELWNKGLGHSPLMVQRIAFCEELLSMLPESDQLSRENTRRGIGESYSALGDVGKADSLFEDWLSKDPTWGWGWIAWSDCYLIRMFPHHDPSRVEKILLKALAVPGLRDREDVLQKLREICSDMGKPMPRVERLAATGEGALPEKTRKVGRALSLWIR
jgi:hypothetical protein